MSLKTVLCIVAFYFIFDLTFAQGDENLLLQYRKGPDITRYRKWNFDLHLRGVMISPNEDYTNPKIGYVLGGNIQYKFSKSIGISSGIGLLSVNYQYNLKDNSTHDQIDYLNFPLAIRVFIISGCPRAAAMCKGVSPIQLDRIFGFAPKPHKISNAAKLPVFAA